MILNDSEQKLELQYFMDMKKILIIILLNVYLSASSVVDIDDKVKTAQEQNKEIMLYFHIPNCSYCQAMLDENFKDTEILEEIKQNFILIDLYAKKDNRVKYRDFKGSVKEFAKHMGAIAYPATIYLDRDEKIVYRSIGYRNSGEHLMELLFISSKSYNTLSLEDFTIKTEFERDD
ncbi:MAG: thioredoxin fold domain-containing protein [Campylobacterota bacterium]|nr:thioredoxin fold domain-containing protein [Campylobacterota bacterium]